MAGQVRPGEFLRLERLAAQFGISVTPVREALQSLRSEGFVVLEPRRGFVVAALSQQDVKDLFWVQAVIAAELTSRAALNLPAPTLRRLEEIQRGMERAADEGHIDQVEEFNHAFHRAINLAADSAKLAWTLGAVSRYVPRGLYGRIPDWPGSCVREHQRILDALRRGNRHAASGAMRMHITVAGELLLKHLQRQGLWDEPTPGKGARGR
jgi:DNA-binding GntR family transcriptional regulator